MQCGLLAELGILCNPSADQGPHGVSRHVPGLFRSAALRLKDAAFPDL